MATNNKKVDNPTSQCRTPREGGNENEPFVEREDSESRNLEDRIRNGQTNTAKEIIQRRTIRP